MKARPLPARRLSRLIKFLRVLAVAFCATVIAPFLILLAAELVVRLAKGGLWSRESPRAAAMQAAALRLPLYFDQELGWLPRDVDANGFRVNGSRNVSETPSLVAVGDSFTAGAGVSDSDTWPACLESLCGICIRNAGVDGFGFDQTVLRAERILQCRHVDLLLVSLIANDLERCEYNYRFGRWKPYFTPAGEGLVFHKAEAPLGSPPPPPASLLLRVIDHSFLLNTLMPKILGPAWYVFPFEPKVANAQVVGPRLVQRLAQVASKHQTAVFLVVQAEVPTTFSPFDKQSAMVAPILGAAAECRIPWLNLIPATQQALEVDASLRERWTQPDGVHLSKEGNMWVAKKYSRR